MAYITYLIYKGNMSVCLSDKYGRAGAVTLAFPVSSSSVGQGKAGQGQGRAAPIGPIGYI